jgi:hypothetical protein
LTTTKPKKHSAAVESLLRRAAEMLTPAPITATTDKEDKNHD